LLLENETAQAENIREANTDATRPMNSVVFKLEDQIKAASILARADFANVHGVEDRLLSSE
jgi:hypothetical protein